MTKLDWDQAGVRLYETGVSHGVFYGSDSKGISWNGLVSVDDNDDTSVEPLHFDGVKYAELATAGDFKGKIRAFTYPDEFMEYEGVVSWKPGFYLTNQDKSRFGLSFRTEIGHDQDPNAGYKIHLLYNLLAIPSTKQYKTLSLDSDPSEFEWDITAIPEQIDRFRPTSHVIIDSRKVDPLLLLDIENLIYGTDTTDPLLPELNGFISFVQKWGRFVVTDNGDGTWTATTPLDGIITMLDEETFQIDYETVEILDATTYKLSSSAVDSGDIWPQ